MKLKLAWITLDQLVEWASTHEEIVKQVVEEMRAYRNNPNFQFTTFLTETVSESVMYYAFVYQENSLVGLSRVRVQNNEGRLSAVVVARNYRGQGMCTKMLEQVVGKCKELDLKRLTLGVRVDNVAAISCYEKTGFKRYQTEKGGYQYDMLL